MEGFRPAAKERKPEGDWVSRLLGRFGLGKQKPEEGMSHEDVVALSETLAAFDKGKEIAFKKVEAERNKFEEQSITDQLTSIFNRRYFEAQGAEFMEELKHNHRKDKLNSVTIIFSDIDHFKKVNDTHGHDAGDEVIKAVAATLQNGVRPGDMAVRLGGEELLVVLRNMTLEDAQKKAEDLRNAIGALSFESQGQEFKVTASLGIAMAERDGEEKTLSSLLHDADAAMYHAKNSGRNQVQVYQKGVTPEKPQKEDKRKTEEASPKPE